MFPLPCKNYHNYSSSQVPAWVNKLLQQLRRTCCVTGYMQRESITVTNLINHVQGECDNAKVVDDHRLLEVERLAVLHQTRSECSDKVDVGKDDHGLRDRGGHERPVLNSWV